MEDYTLTQANFSVNRWKNEGMLIAIMGLLLMLGVIMAGGKLLSVVFLGAVAFFGLYIYSNNRIIRDFAYENPVYLQQGEMQFRPTRQFQYDWASAPQWGSSQKWQNQNAQRRQVNE